MTSRTDIVGQNGSTAAHYILDKLNWSKHKNLPWWRFDTYSIERVGKELICRSGHTEIGRSNDPDKAREICGLHMGVLE